MSQIKFTVLTLFFIFNICINSVESKKSFITVVKEQWNGVSSLIWYFFTKPEEIKDDLPTEVLYNVLDKLNLEELAKEPAFFDDLINIRTYKKQLLKVILNCGKDKCKKNDLKRNLENLVNLCTPDITPNASELINAVKITVFWKFIAALRMVNNPDYPYLDRLLRDAMNEYVKDELEYNDNKYLVYFAISLTPFEHSCICNFLLHEDIHSQLVVAYLLFLEHSVDHLNNRLDYWTLGSINFHVLIANAQCLVNANNHVNLTKINFKLRFDLNNRLGNAVEFSDIVRTANSLLLDHVATLAKTEKYDEMLFSAVYCGIRMLVDKKDFDFVAQKIQLNYALFEIAAQKDKFIKLLSDCAKAELIKTELKEQLAFIANFTGVPFENNKIIALQSDSSEQNYITLLKNVSILSTSKQQKYRNDLIDTIKKKAKSLTSTNDVHDYMDALKIICNINTILDESTYQQAYLAYFTLAGNRNMFHDIDELDNLHEKTFENILDMIREVPQNVDWNNRELLSLIFKSFEPLLSPKPKESSEIRKKQQILLKCLLALGNEVFIGKGINKSKYDELVENSSDMGEVIKKQIFEIIIFAFKLACVCGGDMYENHCLVDEFITFMIGLPNDVKLMLVHSNDAAFECIRLPIQRKTASFQCKNAMVFLCQFLFLQAKDLVVTNSLDEMKKPLPFDKAIENILYFEDELHSKISDRQFKKNIHQLCMDFYVRYTDRIQQLMKKDLRKFVSRSLQYVSTAVLNSNDYKSETVLTLLRSILLAILNDPNPKAKLMYGTPDNLALQLYQVSFTCACEYQHEFDDKLKTLYFECRRKLQLITSVSSSSSNSIKSATSSSSKSKSTAASSVPTTPISAGPLTPLTQLTKSK